MDMNTENLKTQVAEPLQNFFVLNDTLENAEAPIEAAVRDILAAIGEDPDRQGLVKT